MPGGEGVAGDPATALDEATAARFARLALDCVHREYPNKISHFMRGDADARPPRELTPAFYGCYDWHSAVHGHWLLARLVRRFPGAAFSPMARSALARSLTTENISGELRYLQEPGRTAFERPYGLAWLLQLCREIRCWDDPQAALWAGLLEPLERAAASGLASWLPKLRHPIRVGEHTQTAFAFGLVHDWAVLVGDRSISGLIGAKSREFYLSDKDGPLAYEPSGEDFLSPCLGEADLMRRILQPLEFAEWLQGFLPALPADGTTAWLRPVEVSDRADPRLAHLDGLNLSRAWMLRGMAAGLPPGDARCSTLLKTSREHARAALPAVTGENYAGGHWLGTFAVYLLAETGADR